MKREWTRRYSGWLAFARQKLDEVATIAKALNTGRQSVSALLEENPGHLRARARSPRVSNPRVRERLSASDRRWQNKARRTRIGGISSPRALKLPLFPTTTIGSFPQTGSVRAARAESRKGAMTREAYEKFLEGEIERAVRKQESLGLTCSCTANPSAMAWSSISERCWLVSSSRRRLGPELWVSLREAARHFWRCRTTAPHDGPLVVIRPIPHEAAHEGHVDGADHDPHVVIRAG